ncbi:MAG: hypothetical protein SGPRY_014614 [Prymnesium sp.]
MSPAFKLPCTSSDASAPPAKRIYVKQPILQAPLVAHTDVEQACRQLLAQSAGRNDYCYGFMDTCSLCPPLAEAVHNYAHAQSIYSNCMAELGLPTYPTMQSLMKPCESSAEAGSSSDHGALPPPEDEAAVPHPSAPEDMPLHNNKHAQYVGARAVPGVRRADGEVQALHAIEHTCLKQLCPGYVLHKITSSGGSANEFAMLEASDYNPKLAAVALSLKQAEADCTRQLYALYEAANINALLLEFVQAASGLILSTNFLVSLMRMMERTGYKLVVDEVLTWGRTSGSFLASFTRSIKTHYITLGKWTQSGLVLERADIKDEAEEDLTAFRQRANRGDTIAGFLLPCKWSFVDMCKLDASVREEVIKIARRREIDTLTDRLVATREGERIFWGLKEALFSQTSELQGQALYRKVSTTAATCSTHGHQDVDAERHHHIEVAGIHLLCGCGVR